MKGPAVLLAAALTAALCGCASSTAAPERHGHDGVYLYAENCSSCHGRLTSTTKPGRRAARIRSAIRYDIGGMGFLEDRLEPDEIEAIADALTLVRPPEGASGEELYGLYCAGCHGEYEESDISGRTLDDIRLAVATKMCNAVNLQFLGDDELARIADDLAYDGDGTDGSE